MIPIIAPPFPCSFFPVFLAGRDMVFVRLFLRVKTCRRSRVAYEGQHHNFHHVFPCNCAPQTIVNNDSQKCRGLMISHSPHPLRQARFHLFQHSPSTVTRDSSVRSRADAAVQRRFRETPQSEVLGHMAATIPGGVLGVGLAAVRFVVWKFATLPVGKIRLLLRSVGVMPVCALFFTPFHPTIFTADALEARRL